MNPSGLGIGTAPSAFLAHGIRTTVLEIDPVVVGFAQRFFQLPHNLTVVVQDATIAVEQARLRLQDSASPLEGQYDYVVHDVFTGGAEPVELFTTEFLQGLSDLLKPDGVIAIVSLS